MTDSWKLNCHPCGARVAVDELLRFKYGNWTLRENSVDLNTARLGIFADSQS